MCDLYEALRRVAEIIVLDVRCKWCFEENRWKLVVRRCGFEEMSFIFIPKAQ